MVGTLTYLPCYLDDVLDVMSYLLLDITTGLIAASLPVLSVLVTRIQSQYREYRSSSRKGRQIPLRGDSDPTLRRTPHRTSVVGITRLESRSSSETEINGHSCSSIEVRRLMDLDDAILGAVIETDR